jgi:hypothetical protein
MVERVDENPDELTQGSELSPEQYREQIRKKLEEQRKLAAESRARARSQKAAEDELRRREFQAATERQIAAMEEGLGMKHKELIKMLYELEHQPLINADIEQQKQTIRQELEREPVELGFIPMPIIQCVKLGDRLIPIGELHNEQKFYTPNKDVQWITFENGKITKVWKFITIAQLNVQLKGYWTVV